MIAGTLQYKTMLSIMLEDSGPGNTLVATQSQILSDNGNKQNLSSFSPASSTAL